MKNYIKVSSFSLKRKTGYDTFYKSPRQNEHTLPKVLLFYYTN